MKNGKIRGNAAVFMAYIPNSSVILCTKLGSLLLDALESISTLNDEIMK